MSDGRIIIDTQINSSGAESGIKSLGGMASAGLSGVAKAGAAMGVAIGAATIAIGGLVKASVEQYAEFEQLTGGVETLFKNSSSTVMTYADNAYKTAGLSANEYMSTITSFSASLLQGLGGDTAKAAEVGNMAVTDMSDNANKMGTSMDNIVGTYQSLAKGNYAMLDNLKLGFGGTKEEMQRLLVEAEKVSGIHYDISNFSDVINAIHVIQTQIGITGTTAKEASSTIEGSLNMTKSAWKNLLTGMADSNSDFDGLINNLVTSVGAFGENILPRIEIALNGIGKLIEQLLPVIMAKVPAIIMSILPGLLEAGAKIILSLVNGIVTSLPQLLTMGTELMVRLVTGISQALPTLIPAAVECITTIITAMIDNAGAILDVGVQLVSGLIEGLNQIPTGADLIIAALVGIGVAMKVFEVVSIVMGLVEAFKAAQLATEGLTIAQWLYNVAMTANPIGLIIAAVAGLIAAIVYLWTTNEGFRTAIIGAWTAIGTLASSVWGAIVTFFTETIPNAVTSMGTFFTSTVPQFFSDLWTTISTACTDGWNAIANFFTTTIPTWITSIVTWFTELPNKIVYGLGLLIGLLATWGVNVWNYFSTNIPIWINNIVTFFSELPGKIWTFLVDIVTKLGQWGSNIVSWISTNVPIWINNIITFFTELPGKIWTWLVNVVTNITTWGSNMLTEAKTGMTNVVDGIIDTFTNLPSKMLDIGTNIVLGIKQGISDAWDSMTGWIGGLCDSFTQGVKDSFEIKSPSHIFRDEIGRMLVKGIGVGFELETPNLQNTMDSNVSDMVAQLQASVSFNMAHTTASITASANRAAAINNTSNSATTNNNAPLFSVENFYNERDTDIPTIAQELAFHSKRRSIT